MPGRLYPEGAVYLVLTPGAFADESGATSKLHAGDVLTASEARQAGAALRRLVLSGELAEVLADRGLFLLYVAAKARADRAERALGWLVARRPFRL
jgi:hypothetical protein